MPPTDTSRRPSPEALHAAKEKATRAVCFFLQHCLSAVLWSDVSSTHRNLEMYRATALSLKRKCTSAQSLSHVQTSVDKLVGLCDLSSKSKRASPNTITPVSPHMVALVYDKYKQFLQVRNGLVDVVRIHKLLVLPKKEATLADDEYPVTVNDAVLAFTTNVSNLSSRNNSSPILNKLGSALVKLHNMYQEVMEDMAKIKAYVRQQVKVRQELGLCYFSIEFMGEDLLSLVAKKCNYRMVFRLRQVCFAFSKNETMKSMMPHLRIRLLPGLFPHDTTPEKLAKMARCEDSSFGLEEMCCYSRVRQISKNQDKRRGRAVNTVYKNTTVTLVMDLAVTGELPDQSCSHFATYSTRKQQPNGGWDSRHGESQEVAQRRKDDNNEVFARSAWGEVPVEEGMFFKRLDSFAHFRDGLMCSVELVYADTLQPIVSATSSLIETHKAIHNLTRMSMYTANDKSPHPAFTMLHIERLTSQDHGRRYCIKATASGVALSTGQQVDLVHYSPAFEVLASKRTTGKREREGA